MYNIYMDEYNHMIWEHQLEELKFMLMFDPIGFDNCDRLGRTMLLQAIESIECIPDEDGIMKPLPEHLKFIKWLLDQGADPDCPGSGNFSPIEYALDVEADSSIQNNKIYDFSELYTLLVKSGADVKKFEKVLSLTPQQRIDNYNAVKNNA